jgi:hypothetical protein
LAGQKKGTILMFEICMTLNSKVVLKDDKGNKITLMWIPEPAHGGKSRRLGIIAPFDFKISKQKKF